MTKAEITGGCYCGAVRYAASGELQNSSVCYCVDCRRIHAAQSVAWVTFKVGDFAFTKGSPVEYASSPKVIRTFCSSCGVHLTFTHQGFAHVVDIATATLDDPEALPPKGLVFPSQKLNWDTCLDLPTAHDG